MSLSTQHSITVIERPRRCFRVCCCTLFQKLFKPKPDSVCSSVDCFLPPGACFLAMSCVQKKYKLLTDRNARTHWPNMYTSCIHTMHAQVFDRAKSVPQIHQHMPERTRSITHKHPGPPGGPEKDTFNKERQNVSLHEEQDPCQAKYHVPSPCGTNQYHGDN